MKKYNINIIYNKNIEVNEIFIKTLKKIIYKANNTFLLSQFDLISKRQGKRSEL